VKATAVVERGVLEDQATEVAVSSHDVALPYFDLTLFCETLLNFFSSPKYTCEHLEQV
jgi:hypothetical protein